MNQFLLCIGELNIEPPKKPLNPKDWIDGRPLVLSQDFKEKFVEPSVPITKLWRIHLEIYSDVPLEQIYTEEAHFHSVDRRPHGPHEFWWILVNLLRPFFTHQEEKKRILSEDNEKESMIIAKDYDGVTHQIRLKFLNDIKSWDIRLYDHKYTTKGLDKAFVHEHTFD